MEGLCNVYCDFKVQGHSGHSRLHKMDRVLNEHIYIIEKLGNCRNMLYYYLVNVVILNMFVDGPGLKAVGKNGLIPSCVELSNGLEFQLLIDLYLSLAFETPTCY